MNDKPWTWERIQKCSAEYDAFRLAVSQGDDRPLHHFLYHLTMDSQPDALPFHRIYRPWQWDRICRRAPMIEAACGKNPAYNGPRCSWETWPRGHDKTGETARMVVWAVAFASRPVVGTVVASDEEQAGFLREAAARTIDLNPWLRPFVEVQAKTVTGRMGEVKIKPYDAAGAYGATDDIIICDELTWWKGRALFDTLISGLPKRKSGTFFVTTNAGILGTWQHENLERFRSDPLWSVYESPQGVILADWMDPKMIAMARKAMHGGTARRVYDNEWIDATESPLLTLDDIIQCEDRGCLWNPRPDSFGYRPELYMGVDIGRTNDKTVIWTVEVVWEYPDHTSKEKEPVFYTREILELSNCPFHEQRRLIEQRLTKDVVRCSIDQGSIGYELAEDFHRHYGAQVERVSLSSGKQGQLALRVRELMRACQVRIPKLESIRKNFQRIQAVETSPGGLPMIKTPRDSTGHCDEFWAFALALGSMPTRPMERPRTVAFGARSRHATRL